MMMLMMTVFCPNRKPKKWALRWNVSNVPGWYNSRLVHAIDSSWINDVWKRNLRFCLLQNNDVPGFLVTWFLGISFDALISFLLNVKLEPFGEAKCDEKYRSAKDINVYTNIIHYTKESINTVLTY